MWLAIQNDRSNHVLHFAGNLTYRVVGIADDNTYQAASGVQVLSSALNGQYYVIGSTQDVLGET